jgi:two-component system CheB/CheR fusion protein
MELQAHKYFPLHNTAGRYAFAMLLVISAAILHWTFPAVLGGTPFLAFFPAVVAAAAFGGFGPGILATLASAFCVNAFLTSPVGQITLTDPIALARQGLFIAAGVGISFIVRALRTKQVEVGEHRARLGAIVESSDDAIVSTNLEGTILSWSPAAERMFGYTAEEIVGKSIRLLLPPERVQEEDDILRRLRQGERIDHYDTVRITRDGRRFEASLTISPLKAHDGRVVGVLKIVHDITERRQVEAARISQQTMGRIIEAAMDAIVTIDEEQRILQFNPAAERMFRCPAAEALGSPIDRFIPQRFRHVHAQHIRDFGQTGRTSRAMGRLGAISGLRADGEEFPIEASISQVDVGGTKLFSVILRDVTERKRADDALVAAKEAAEEASRAKDRFMAVVSHELRTPLTPVLAAVSMFQKDPQLNENLRKTLEMVRRNVELEARLIDDLLDLTRIARGRIELDKRLTELSTIITRAVEVCRPDIEARRLHLGVDLGSMPYMVEADAARLQQVFWSLLKNSVRFTPPGGCVGIRCGSNGPGRVVIEVNDSGVGIAPEAMGQIFSAFAQADKLVSRQFGGLGLGLAISKTLVELHGGTIEAQSAGKDRGSTFKVKLPIVPRPQPRVTEMHRRRAGQEPRKPEAAHLRLLLVEDHGDTAEMMRSMLAAEGHQVQTAGDVATALDLVTQEHFDVLLSDLGLPDGSGLDLIRELHARGQDMPAIALSGYGQEQDVEESRRAGFAMHLVKPVDMDRLQSALANVHIQGRANPVSPDDA